jgi:hypothetical protein
MLINRLKPASQTHGKSAKYLMVAEVIEEYLKIRNIFWW